MEYSIYLNKKLANRINAILLIISGLVLCICFVNIFEIENQLRWLILLPITHFICVLLLNILQKNINTNLFNSLLFGFYLVQYQLYPLFMFCTGSVDLSRYSGNLYNKIPSAVLLQCVVLMFVWFYSVLSNNKISNFDILEPKDDYFVSKRSKRLIVFLIIASIGLIIVYPQFLLKYRLIFYSDSNSYYSYLDASHSVKGSMPVFVYQFGLWMLQITKVLLVYYIVVFLWRKSRGKNQLIYILISTGVLTLSCIITTEDKAVTVFCALAVLLLMMRLYPAYIKTIIWFSTIFFMLFILGIFIILPMINSGSLDILAYKLNAYFAGTVNVAGGLLMKRNNLLYSFMGDILRSIPMINHFFKNLPMSYLEYNSAIGYDTIYNSQIIPIISQGYYYFGYLGAIVYPILLIRFAKRKFNKMMSSNGSYEFFVYSMLFLFSFLGLYLYDLALTFSQIMNYCLPIYMLYFISRRKRSSTVK